MTVAVMCGTCEIGCCVLPAQDALLFAARQRWAVVSRRQDIGSVGQHVRWAVVSSKWKMGCCVQHVGGAQLCIQIGLLGATSLM